MRKSKKEYLYKSIFKLFLSKHYELVTIRDIESATGMTRGAVFYYAPNKQELFCDIVDTYFFQAQDLDDKLAELQNMESQGNTLLDFIHKYVQAVDLRMEKLEGILGMKRVDASRAYLNFILQAQDYYPSFNERMTAIFDAELRIWEHMLKVAQEKNEIKSSLDIKYFAKIFRYFYVGLCYQTALSNGVNVAELEIYFMSIYMLIKN